MKHFPRIALMLLLPLIAACEDGSVRNTLGLDRAAPDEFTVVSRPPLSVPPEFTLRPPRPGEEPRGLATDAQARSLITGKPVAPSDVNALDAPTVESAVTPVLQNDALSMGANSLLKRAGADAADETIRSKLGEDARRPVDTSNAKTLLDQLSGAEKNEPTVDAKKEAERLRDNKDAGKPLNEGEVAEEKPVKRSLIDRIF